MRGYSTYKPFIIGMALFVLALVILNGSTDTWSIPIVLWCLMYFAATLVGQAVYLLTMPAKHRKVFVVTFVILSVLAYLGLGFAYWFDNTWSSGH